MDNWQNLFRSHILDRGYYYFEDFVEDFVVKNEQIEAVVCGSEVYQVEIKLAGNQIISLYCDCPHAADGNHCKHMAAVLYTYEFEYQEKEPAAVQKSSTTNLNELLIGAEESLVRSFLLEILEADEKLALRFAQRVSPKVSEVAIKNYRHQIASITQRHSDCSGFIDYYHADAYTQELLEFLNEDIQPMIDNQQHIPAFRIICYLADAIEEVEVDDSDGGIGLVADQCQCMWEELLSLASLEEKREMYPVLVARLEQTSDYFQIQWKKLLKTVFPKPNFWSETYSWPNKSVSRQKLRTLGIIAIS